jgi:tRNA nucleotidyltransferase (CCA-adding enzyme)
VAAVSSDVDTSKAPKGRHHRCGRNFYVGDVPTKPGELVWRLVDGVPQRVRSPKQLGGAEVLVVTNGEVPTAADFAGGPSKFWSALTDPSRMLRGGQRGGRPALSATVAAHPRLAPRVAASVAATRPRFDPIAGAPDARTAVSIASAVAAEGGRALLVGGAVRDSIVGGAASKDLDIEVFGISAERLGALLGRFGVVDTTGARFAVLKLHGTDLDISLPRTERKVAAGHRGFIVDADPDLPPERAALRRDFTMNAISFDLLSGELVDPVGGVADLRAGVLRHVSDQFAEDPLRVVRAAQFTARFDLRAHPDTIEMCRSLRSEAETLPTQPLFDEWNKMLMRGTRPGEGLRFLDQVDWIDRWPELADLRGVGQDPRWHPEGDVFVHTAHALDAWASFRDRDQDPDDALVVALAIMCHDFGKASTTVEVDGRWRALGHEEAGVAPARAFLAEMCPIASVPARVAPLVEHHLAPSQLFAQGAGDAAVRRLAAKVGRIDLLVDVAHADAAGRPPKVVERFEAGEWLLERAEALSVRDAKPKPVIGGKELIALGLRPGPVFSQLLGQVLEAQIDGEVTDPSSATDLARRLATERGLLD